MANPTLPMRRKTAPLPAAKNSGASGERARHFQRHALADSTIRLYRTDAAIWRDWCTHEGIDALSANPRDVARFLAHQADHGLAEPDGQGRPLKLSTLRRRLAGIRKLYDTAGHPSPTRDPEVAMVMRGIARERAEPPARKTALEADDVKALIAKLPTGPRGALTLTGLRDRAILLVGFAGAFRRSELVALDVADLEFAPEGLAIMIRRSKTDPEAKGKVKAIRRAGIYCPAAALQAWLTAVEIEDDPVFRWVRRGGHVTHRRITPDIVARIVIRYADAAGLEGDFSAHSLRAGFVTSARKNGAELEDVMAVTHHRAVQTVQGYFREADRFRANPLAGML